MFKKLNPVDKKGSRNLLCPYYNECLNHAAHLHWQTWSCSNCYYRQMCKNCKNCPMSSGDSMPYHKISPDILHYAKIKLT